MSNEAPQHLYRSRRHRMVCGVAGGLGEYLDVDPTFIRLGLVALLFLSAGLIGLLYLAACIIMPDAPFEGEAPPAGASAAIGATPGSGSSGGSFEKKMEDFGQRMNEMGERLGKAAEEIGQKVGAAATDAGKKAEESAKSTAARVEVSVRAGIHDRPLRGPRLWFGLILVAAGFLLLANQLEIFKWTREFVMPTILILIGIAIVVNSVRFPPLKPPVK